MGGARGVTAPLDFQFKFIYLLLLLKYSAYSIVDTLNVDNVW